jgi:hypothetical protein
MDAAAQPNAVGFVTCPQLSAIFDGVGLHLSPPEIELLATGAYAHPFFLVRLLSGCLAVWLVA